MCCSDNLQKATKWYHLKFTHAQSLTKVLDFTALSVQIADFGEADFFIFETLYINFTFAGYKYLFE